MNERKKAHAPYNFIPFAEDILLPYENAAALPRHDRQYPDLLSGEICLSLRAETPVFVSDGKGAFFRGPNGQLAIPGSTLRGMVRENMQILGFASVRPGDDLADQTVFFRKIASGRDQVPKPLQDYYHKALGVKLIKGGQNGKPRATPTIVKAGYLSKREGRCYIHPVRGNYKRISRRDPCLRPFQTGDLWKDQAKVVEVRYDPWAGQLTLYPLTDPQRSKLPCGCLLYTGKAVGKCSNPVYFFPAKDPAAKKIPLSEEDVINYQEDWEKRKNVLKPSSFWGLPKEGEEKPVFYIPDFEGHTYWGMSLFLRIGYRHSIAHGLPERDKQLKDGPALDYLRAILGFAGKDAAYRSRVSFGDLLAEKEAQESAPVRVILGEPKPSYYPGYTIGGHYNEEYFTLRGYKQYWLKRIPDKPNAIPGKDKVASILRPLPGGTVFRGVIRYKNLTREELGLLLWSLRLEKGCFQSIGMGKPLGYGRMSLTIEKLREFTLAGLYDALAPSVRESGAAEIDEYIRAYDQTAASKLFGGKSILEREEIKDFFYLRSKLQPNSPEFSYMDLKKHQNSEVILPTVRDYRKQNGG